MTSARWILGLAAGLLLATNLTGCSRTSRPVTSNETAVALGNSWGQTLATRDLQRIASQYADDAVLLATFTNKIPAQQDRVEYFAGLAKNRNLRVQYNTMVPAVLNENAVTLSGLYTFMYEDKRGKTVKAPARYTFVWEKRDGEWKIVKHHSSLRPEKK